MTSSTGLRHVDHDFVEFEQNLARVDALIARGGGEESGGGGGSTIWSPELGRRRPWRSGGRGARREHGPGGLGERGAGQEGEELTTSRWLWSETAGRSAAAGMVHGGLGRPR